MDAPPIPGYRPLRSLARNTQILLGVYCAANVVGNGLTTLEEAEPSAASTLALALAVVMLAGCVVGWCLWTYRAARNARALHPGRPFEHSAGWAVGWFFVPFANLVMPLRALKEIWRNSAGDAARDAPGFLGGWWAAWVISNVIDSLAARLPSVPLTALASLAEIAAAVLAIRVLRDLTALQEHAARVQHPIAVFE